MCCGAARIEGQRLLQGGARTSLVADLHPRAAQAPPIGGLPGILLYGYAKVPRGGIVESLLLEQHADRQMQRWMFAEALQRPLKRLAGNRGGVLLLRVCERQPMLGGLGCVLNSSGVMHASGLIVAELFIQLAELVMPGAAIRRMLKRCFECRCGLGG